jgi:hypothetical protein
MRLTILIPMLVCLMPYCYAVSNAVAAEDEDLVLYLAFDDDGRPEDLSPRSSVIASHIEPAELVEGIKGNAWLFDESTLIFLANPTFEAPFQQSSFSVWIREPGPDGIIYEEGGTTKGFAVSLVKGEVQFATRDASVQTTIGSDYPDDGDWHMIAAVFDLGTMRLYVDGELMEEELKVPGINSHSNDMGIGAVNGGQCTCGHSSKFTGIMDEFRITRRAVTAEEVKKTYQDVIRSLAVAPSGKCHTTWADAKTTN